MNYVWYDTDMAAKKTTLKGIIFFLILIVLAMGYSMYTISRKNSKETYVKEESENTDSSTKDTSSSADTTADFVAPQKMEDDALPDKVAVSDTCEKDLIAKLKTDKTEYEKGRILVGFNKDVSFVNAKSVMSRYDLIPVLAGVDEDSYLSLRLLTVNVPTGREPYFVCLLKKDSSVRYTNVNILLYTKPI